MKFTALLLSFVVLALIVTACAGQSQDPPPPNPPVMRYTVTQYTDITIDGKTYKTFAVRDQAESPNFSDELVLTDQYGNIVPR